MTESRFHPSWRIASTTACPTVCSSRHASASRAGTLDLDEAEGAIEKHIAVKWHVIALPGGDRVPPARVPHESLLHHPPRWLCCPVQQGHHSLGHESQVHMPSRHWKWATSSRERRTVSLGTAGSLLPCFVPKDTAQWQVLLHHDVASHQQPFCKEAWRWKELVASSPHCNATRAS